MPTSIHDGQVEATIRDAHRRYVEGWAKEVHVDSGMVRIASPFPSPADWRCSPIYFLLIDRFNNPVAPPAERWDSEAFRPMGGTFDGVRCSLDYLKTLGVGTLWLSPFQKEVQFCYGYGAQDFLSIDARYGGEAELMRLIDEAHARGIRVIADAVINHAGDVFAYEGDGRTWRRSPWSERPYAIRWRDESGSAVWDEVPVGCHPDAAVWPVELQRPEAFRRQGINRPEDPSRGDFGWLKELDPDARVVSPGNGSHESRLRVQDVIIKAFQYWIARLDLDGLRVDSLKHVELPYARRFCTCIREFAATIGKSNFLLIGEVRGSMEEIAPYIGRALEGDPKLEGLDSGIHFPFRNTLIGIVKHDRPVETLISDTARWNDALLKRTRGGEPLTQMVTMIDDHDSTARFYDGTENGRLDLLTALAWMFVFPGIPCLYYGTEQGLRGRTSAASIADEWLYEGVREALWGMPGAFDQRHPFFQAIVELTRLRRRFAALSCGRAYWRPLSVDGRHFELERSPGGRLALSRIAASEELLTVGNFSKTRRWTGLVLVDAEAHREGERWCRVFSTAVEPFRGDEMGPPAIASWVSSPSFRAGSGLEAEAQVLAVSVELDRGEVAIFCKDPAL